MSTRDLALAALVTKCIADLATAAVQDRRAELAAEMAAGDRVGVTAPGQPDVKVGIVYRTEPKGTGVVTDRAAFTKWMTDTYPGRVQVVVTLPRDPDKIAAAVEVLYRHAPHLLSELPVVEPWAENEVLACTARAREACGPGGELDIPGIAYEPPGPGVVTVKLSGDGPAVIEALWCEGRIDLRTGHILELETSEPT